MFTRIVGAVLGFVALAVGVVCFWPQWFGLERTNPWAFAVASRGASALIALAVVAILSILAFFGKAVRRLVRPMMTWLTVFAVASAIVVFTRGWSNTPLTNAPTNHITVFSWNTFGAKAGASEIAKLALEAKANVLTLAETPRSVGEDVASLMSASGHPMTVLSHAFDNIYKAHSTTMLISTTLGHYHLTTSLGTTSTSPSLVAVPSDSSEPTIVAAHAIEPSPGELSVWRSDLSWLAARCTQKNVIMAGDFNASIDNVSGLGPAAFGNCGDVALKLGAASIGTWPTDLPSLLGTQIDHVFYSAEWRPIAITIDPSFSKELSDHRPVVATLVRVAN